MEVIPAPVKVGRPRKEICIETLKELAMQGATILEMARYFRVSHGTIEHRLQEHDVRSAVDEGYAELDLSLRRKQVQVAMEGNPTMLIWLGKQRLGQRDSHDLTVQGTGPSGRIELGVSAVDAFESRITELAARAAEARLLPEPNGNGS